MPRLGGIEYAEDIMQRISIDRGDPSIGLPPYNGGLFAPGAAPMLNTVYLSDAAVSMQQIEEMSDADVAEVRESASLFAQVEEATAGLRGLLDFFCGWRWLIAGMKQKKRAPSRSHWSRRSDKNRTTPTACRPKAQCLRRLHPLLRGKRAELRVRFLPLP